MDNLHEIVMVKMLTYAHDAIHSIYYESEVIDKFFLEMFQLFDGGIS